MVCLSVISRVEIDSDSNDEFHEDGPIQVDIAESDSFGATCELVLHAALDHDVDEGDIGD